MPFANNRPFLPHLRVGEGVNGNAVPLCKRAWVIEYSLIAVAYGLWTMVAFFVSSCWCCAIKPILRFINTSSRNLPTARFFSSNAILSWSNMWRSCALLLLFAGSKGTYNKQDERGQEEERYTQKMRYHSLPWFNRLSLAWWRVRSSSCVSSFAVRWKEICISHDKGDYVECMSATAAIIIKHTSMLGGPQDTFFRLQQLGLVRFFHGT